MRMFALGLGLGLALSAGAAQAAPAAAPAGVASDARCLMTMAALSSSKEETRARAAQAGVIYFAGRIKARDPSYDFGARLKAVAASLTREDVVTEAQRCGPMLTETLRELDAAQKSLPAPKPAVNAKPPAKP